MKRAIAILLIGAIAFLGLYAVFMKKLEPSGSDADGAKKFGLIWPIDCVPNDDCAGGIGYPDINNDGYAFNGKRANYKGHEGTDIRISKAQMAAGVDVFAAADGEVLWVFDGHYDRCPDPGNPQCKQPTRNLQPGESQGTTVCTDLGNYCGTGDCCCYWCFAGGNVVVIRHKNTQGVFATRYDHLKKGSILVKSGQKVSQGEKIAEVASAGHSTEPHLHFEVWGRGFYKVADPWDGAGTDIGISLWTEDPPWRTLPRFTSAK